MSKCDHTSPQKKQKVPIDDVVRSVLAGRKQALALDFIAYLKSLRMTPQWASHHSWAVSYKGKRVCYIKVSETGSEGAWYVRPSVQYDDALENFCRAEGLITCMLKNVHFCVACGRCAPGKAVTFFGQRLEHVCCAPIDFEFHDPDEAELACAKKLVLYSRQRIGQQYEGASKQV